MITKQTQKKYERYINSLTRYVTETVHFEACKFPAEVHYISLYKLTHEH
jgi:tRNA U34 5-carboxymethylaminomethyl modifying enzyme MnmG/GidA